MSAARPPGVEHRRLAVRRQVIGEAPANLSQQCSLLRKPVVVDLRNIYERDEAEREGFTYYGIGR